MVTQWLDSIHLVPDQGSGTMVLVGQSSSGKNSRKSSSDHARNPLSFAELTDIYTWRAVSDGVSEPIRCYDLRMLQFGYQRNDRSFNLYLGVVHRPRSRFNLGARCNVHQTLEGRCYAIS